MTSVDLQSGRCSWCFQLADILDLPPHLAADHSATATQKEHNNYLTGWILFATHSLFWDKCLFTGLNLLVDIKGLATPVRNCVATTILQNWKRWSNAICTSVALVKSCLNEIIVRPSSHIELLKNSYDSAMTSRVTIPGFPECVETLVW